MAWSLIAELDKHEGLMTVAEAAALRRCHRSNIYQKIESGEIPAVNWGKDSKQKLIDPQAWKYMLLKLNPTLREAHRKG